MFKSFIQFFIFALYICVYIFPISNGAHVCDQIRTSGTGTVLFGPTDLYRSCWSQDEMARLTAKIILEDVIPDVTLFSVQCNDDIDDLVEYFKEIIEYIRTKSSGRKRHILLLALTDLLGGFLHHALLPKARKAYYAGAVDYSYMEKLIQLYEELKWFLRTNGQGWTKPLIIKKDVPVPIIEMSTLNDESHRNESCTKLMYYEHEPLRVRKRSLNMEKGVYFPQPFFDAKYRPTAIALPFKHFALRNIESKRAAYAVMKFFIEAEHCLKEKNVHSEVVQKFHNNLYTWIEKEAIPKLNDDRFYSAFGGIMRVYNTLKAMGAVLINKPCIVEEGEEEVGAIPGVGCNSRRNKLLLIAMLVIIVAWFLIGTCFICYRMRTNRSKDFTDPDKPSTSKSSPLSSAFSSAKWSSMLSRSRSSSPKTDRSCKCCESSISEKSSTEFSPTSENDSDRKNKKQMRNKNSKCFCPEANNTNQSVNALPSISEMSEKSQSKSKSSRKISFANQTNSEGGLRICVPSWAKDSIIHCPNVAGKTLATSTSRSSIQNIQDPMNDSMPGDPIANSSRIDQTTTDNRDDSQRDISNTTNFKTAREQSSSDNTRNSLSNSSNNTNSTSNSGGNVTPPEKYKTSTTLPEKISDQQIRESRRRKSVLHQELQDESEIKQNPQSYFDYHTSACHNTMSGSYDLFRNEDSKDPYLFGYDMHTSTSSELSEEEP